MMSVMFMLGKLYYLLDLVFKILNCYRIKFLTNFHIFTLVLLCNI